MTDRGLNSSELTDDSEVIMRHDNFLLRLSVVNVDYFVFLTFAENKDDQFLRRSYTILKPVTNRESVQKHLLYYSLTKSVNASQWFL